MSHVPSDWEVVIGLEVHVQLHTRAKVFASSPWGFGQEPNEQVDPVVLGLPGTLPVVNREAVEKAILFGLVVYADGLMLAHHVTRGARELDLDLAADDDREVLLGELVVLGIIRVEIVLPVPGAALRDLCAHDEAEEDGFFDRLAVHHRQRAGEAEDDRVDLLVGLLAETPGGGREDLGAGVQLHVDLETDDDFPIRRCVAHRAAC